MLKKKKKKKDDVPVINSSYKLTIGGFLRPVETDVNGNNSSPI